MRTIIITGANGFIGSELVKYFSSIGWKVRALARTVTSEDKGNINYYAYDLAKPVDEAVFANADYLVHCAYMKYERGNNADEINLEGTRQLINMCRKYNVKPVFLSSFSAHEDAVSHYGKHKLALEKMFDEKRDLILKPGLVLGKSGLFNTIAEVIRTKKIIPLVGGGTQPLQVIAVDDLCKVTAAALDKGLHGKFYVAEPTVITMKQLYDAIAERSARKVVYFPLPLPVAMMMTRTAEAFGMKLPVSSESVLGLKQLRSFDTRKDMEAVEVRIKNVYQILDELFR